MKAVTAKELLEKNITESYPQTLESKVEKGLVVEFTNAYTGKVVSGVDGYPVGYESNSWDISSFKQSNN
jgi:hypothetical protein